MLGKIEDRRRRGQQRMKQLDDIMDSMDVSLSKLREIVKGKEAWRAAVHGSQRVGHDLVTEQQFNDSFPQMEIEARSEGTCLFNAQDFNHQTRFPCFYSISGYFFE